MNEIKLEKCVNTIFDKLFKPFGYNHKTITQKQWKKLRWTEQEHNKFKEWIIKYLIKNMRWSKYRAEKEASWFMLAYSPAFKEEDGVKK